MGRSAEDTCVHIYDQEMRRRAEAAQSERSEGTAEECCSTCGMGWQQNGWVRCLEHGENRTNSSICVDWQERGAE